MSSERERSGKKAWFADGKNILIFVLLLVIAAQAWLLVRRSGAVSTPASTAVEAEPAPTAGQPGKIPVRVAKLAPEPEFGRYLLVAFNEPIGQDRVGQSPERPVADINPVTNGTWTWISPFVLRFDAERPFEPGTDYFVYVQSSSVQGPGHELVGEQSFMFNCGLFQVADWNITEEPAPEGKGQINLVGKVEFTYAVDPEALAQHFRVLDPLRGKDEPVDAAITTTWRSRTAEFRVGPLKKTTEPRQIKFAVTAGLPAARSDLILAADAEETIDLVLDPVLRVEKITADSQADQASLSVEFSSAVQSDVAAARVKVSPTVSFRAAAAGRTLTLSGGFKPGSSYTVTVSKGLQAADGAVLEEDYSERLHVPDIAPQAKFLHPGMFLSRTGYRNLALQTVNVAEVELSVERIYYNNIFMLVNDYQGRTLFDDTAYVSEIEHYLGDRLVEKKLKTTSTRNVATTTPLGLDAYIKDSTPGFYRVSVKLPDEWEAAQRWVLITDMGLVAKKGDDELLVWVSSFADLSPKAGVKLRVLSDQNQLVAEGQTGADGLWRAGNLGALMEKNRPFLIMAEKDGDVSFLLFNDFGIDTAGLDVGGVDVARQGYTAYLYGERDIYRPGETLKGLAVVRDARLQTPPPLGLRLRQKDPKGRELGIQPLKTDARGLAEFSLPLPAYALTGGYTLELLAAETVIGSYRFKVEEFVPDRIKVEIDPAQAVAQAGGQLDFKVASRYFFGPPAAGMNVEARVRLVAAPFAPKGYEAYDFGNVERSFQAKDIFASEDSLNEQGEHSYQVALPSGLTPPAALEAILGARVRERGGRGVAAMQRIPVHSYPRYPGLKRMTRTGVKPGEAVKLSYVMLSPDGKETPGGELRADFFEDRWQTVLRRTPGNGFRYESIKDSWLLSSQAIAKGEPRGEITVTPPKHGSFRVVLSDPATGAACQTTFYAHGWGYSPWAIENPARLELVADKEEYAAGEQATLQIRAPFAGKLLLTVEGDSVFEVQIHTLEGNTAKVVVPVRAEYSPNAYVTAVLVRSVKDLEPGAVARAFGSVPLNVDRTVNRPKLTIAAPAEVRPETRLSVRMQTEPNATVTLAAVDEGILQLINQQTPDPFPFFYAKRALRVASFDIFSLLLPEIPSLVNTAPAGGDAAMDRLRQLVRTEGIRRIKPVSYWSGILTADAAGTLEYGLDLPDFQGALRLMAVAIKDRRFSSAHLLTRVKGPLNISPTFPRSMAMDETVLIPTTLRNDSASDAEFSLSLTCTGPVRVAEETVRLAVPKGSERLAYFTLHTGHDEGLVLCRSQAEGNGEKTKTEVEAPVRPAFPARTLVQAGSAQESPLALPFDSASGLIPSSVTRELRIGRTPFVRYARGLKDLLGYPYGCTEQIVARAFPLLYVRDLAAELDPALFKDLPPTGQVQRAIQMLQPRQIHGGGFGLWPEAREADPWVSLFTAHFLLEARRAGYQVSESFLKEALEYASSLAKVQDKYGPETINRACYALFVLALAGKPDRGSMDFLLVRQRASLTEDAAFLLGAAYALSGDKRALDGLASGRWVAVPPARETGGNYGSPLRNSALRLTVLLQAAPQDQRIARLTKDMTGLMDATPHMSTQEAAFAFVALGKLFAQQKQKAPFAGKVFLGTELLGEFSSEKVFLKTDIPGQAPLRIEFKSGYEPGAAYYSLLTRGVPSAKTYTPVSKGLKIERTLLTRDGKPVPEQGLAQGDLVILQTRVMSLLGPLRNVVIQNLLPTGLEVENPRLETTEKLPWITASDAPAYQDARDDRVLLFVDLPAGVTTSPARSTGKGGDAVKEKWTTYSSLLRAVTPGTFTLPPAQAEAMYDPDIMAAGQPGSLTIRPDSGEKPKHTPPAATADGGVGCPDETVSTHDQHGSLADRPG